MRFIDLGSYTPHADWIKKSEKLTQQLTEKHEQGNTEARNKIIDNNAQQWGKTKDELLNLSDGKCWFSEVRDTFSHLDIDHFRPKKKAKDLDGKIRDGYWWLAFDHINFRVCGNVGNRKKGGWFPLKTGSLVSTYKDPCEDAETPYLLDPTDPGDISLIAFNEEGKLIPAPGTSDWEKKRVEVTTERLKLNKHPPLVEARRRVWHDVSVKIEEYLDAKSRASTGGNPVAKEKVATCLKTILKMTQKSAELSAVARWCVEFRNIPQLKTLIG